MLQLIPIQFLALFAYFLLRLGAGLLLFHLGTNLLFTHPRPRGWLVCGSACTFLGLLLLVGLATQLTALGVAVLSLGVLIAAGPALRQQLPDRYFWILLTVLALALFITGPGTFAIDYPI